MPLKIYMKNEIPTKHEKNINLQHEQKEHHQVAIQIGERRKGVTKNKPHWMLDDRMHRVIGQLSNRGGEKKNR
jgi:hypothetical protein